MQFLSPGEIVLRGLGQLWPVWASLAVVLGLSVAFRRRLGLYGQVVHSGAGFAGLLLVLFWLFAAIFAGGDRTLRSAWPDRGNEGRTAGRDRAALGPSLSLRRRQARARRVRPGRRRRAHRAHHRTARDDAGAVSRRRARPAGGLLRPANRRGPVVSGQSGPRLPGHPAVLPFGVAGHSRNADPLYAGRRLLHLSRSSF